MASNDKTGTPPFSRRDFIRSVATASCGAAISGLSGFGCGGDDTEIPPSDTLPTRPLGQTGFRASILGMGGVYLTDGSETQIMAVLDRALELGINYFDTAANYGEGESERRLGKWLRKLQDAGRRSDIFVTTKSDDRGYDDSARQIEASLRHLQSDSVDMILVHGVGNLDTWADVSGPSGSLQAIKAAKEDGRARFVGISGHRDPRVLLRAIEEYPFDCVLCPLGITDRIHVPFVRDLLPTLLGKNLGIIGMKVFAEGHLPDVNANLERCLHYSLSLPSATSIVGMSSLPQVEQNVAWVRSLVEMTQEQMDELASEIAQIIDLEALWWKS